ncbi:MAG: GNAT family N-acetyltransferase [Solirubrobacterales bacterium]
MSSAGGGDLALPGGERIGVRPIGPADKRRLSQAFERLSPESRYRRFFAPLTSLSAQDLAYLTEVDHHDHEALVGIDPCDGSIVGVARFVRTDEPAEAEVAVVVADPWQGLGVGTALLERLVERAREEGVGSFVALVLSDNEEALEMFRNLAPDSSWIRPSASGHTEMHIELPEPGALAASRLGRVLSTVAREALSVNPWSVLRRTIGRRTAEIEFPEDNRPIG